MNLMMSQLTRLPIAADCDEATAVQPAAGGTPADLKADVQAGQAFSDTLLNTLNSLLGGEQQPDSAQVLADATSTDDGDQNDRQNNAIPRVEELTGSPQQLLDALLMASQMPLKTVDTPTGRPLTGDALSMQKVMAGPPARINVASESIAKASKPAVTDIAKPLMTLAPMAGPPAFTQLFTPETDKQAVSLPPIKLDADEAKWAQQLQGALNDRLQLQIKNQVQHATIRLDPPEMGKVDISLQIENGRMQVHISASNGETWRALQQISNELRQSLMEQNFVQVHVQVSSQSGQSQQGRGQQHTPAPPDSPIAGADVAAGETRTAVNNDDSVLLTV